MPETGYARTMAPVVPYQRPQSDKPVIGTDWEVLAIYRADPPTDQAWFAGVRCVADVDPGVTGELRLRARQGTTEVISPTTTVTTRSTHVLGYQGVPNNDQFIYIEGRRTVGNGGVRLIDAGVTLMSGPPFQTGAPPAPNSQVIPDGSILVKIDAGDPSTWAETRPFGQWIVAANRIQVGAAGDDLNLGTGYGLVWDGPGTTIDGAFTMEDGQSERLMPDTVGAIDVIHAATQFISDGSYSPANNQPAGNNSGINVGVGQSDPLYFDGTRFQLSILEPANFFKVGDQGGGIGRPADVVRYVTSFLVEDWMAADDFTTAIFELHEPTGTKTSPLTSQLRLGELRVFGRLSDTQLAPTDPNPPDFAQIATLTLPAVGQWCTAIYDFKIDPAGTGGGTGYFNLWTLDASGDLQQVASVGNTWGYIFDQTDPSLNDSFYCNMLQFYQFHEFTPGAVDNWDPTGANPAVRRLRTPYAALMRGADVSIEEMQGHARFYLGL